MNSIVGALASGYSANKVLQYLSKSIPSLAPAIQKAQIAGYAADKILSFLGESVDKEETKHLSGPRRQARNNFLKGQLVKNAAATMVGGLASKVPSIASNLQQQPTLPNAPVNPANPAIPGALVGPGVAANANVQPQVAINATQTVGGPSPSVQQGLVQNLVNRAMPQGQKISIPQTQQPPVNQVSPNIPQVAETVQPEEKISNISDVLWNKMEKNSKAGLSEDDSGFMKIAKRMRTTGEIASKEDFHKFHSMFMDERREGKSLVDALKTSSRKYDREKYYPEKPGEKEEPSINKGSVVASSQGVGEIKEIRNGKAIVEVDGKKHQVNEEELISSPLPEKDLADLYDDLIGGIEKTTGQEVSKNVEWAGYDPKVNELIYKPHGSDKVYVYDDISPEDAQQLTSLLTQRKTTGENFVGPWTKGTTSPIGAAMHKLIQKIQGERGGKGNEYRNRFDTIYDAFEPAKLAKKKKHAERKKKAKESGIA